MTIKCPHCGELCESDEEIPAGCNVECPFCSNKFYYGADAGNVANPSNAAASNAVVKNHMVKAILQTLVCAPAGIIPLIYACKVNKKLAQGDIAGAQAASKKASLWLNITTAVFAPLIVLIIGFKAMSNTNRTIENARRANGEKFVEEGMKFSEKKNYSRAYNAFLKAAKCGIPQGKLFLAECLIEGYGCDKNHEKAFALLSEDDVRDFPMAKYLMGMLRMNGSGCLQDFAKAAQLLKSAADAGNPYARQFLGYQEGKMPDYGLSLEELLRQEWLERNQGR